jgi:hypothetical protein
MPPNHVACYTGGSRQARRLNLRALGVININIPDTSNFLRAEFMVDRLSAYGSMPTQWGKLADRDSVPGQGAGFAPVELAHDLAALIAQPLLRIFRVTPAR